LYVKVVDVLVGRLSYPAGFTSWDEEVSLDAEDFARHVARSSRRNRLPRPSALDPRRFREGELTKELLESAYSALRAQFFYQLRQKLEAGGGQWQVRRTYLM
jgi:hypothetical protein